MQSLGGEHLLDLVQHPELVRRWLACMTRTRGRVVSAWKEKSLVNMSPHQRPHTLLVVLHVLLDRHLHLGQEAVHKGLVFILPLTLPSLPLVKELVKVILNVCFFRLIVLVVLRVVWDHGLRICRWRGPDAGWSWNKHECRS